MKGGKIKYPQLVSCILRCSSFFTACTSSGVLFSAVADLQTPHKLEPGLRSLQTKILFHVVPIPNLRLMSVGHWRARNNFGSLVGMPRSFYNPSVLALSKSSLTSTRDHFFLFGQRFPFQLVSSPPTVHALLIHGEHHYKLAPRGTPASRLRQYCLILSVSSVRTWMWVRKLSADRSFNSFWAGSHE
jgi:hypothetical protein